jgi:YVTN family beta-propeller protein
MKTNIKVILTFISAGIIFNSCKKVEDEVVQPPVTAPAQGIYVLSEGGFGSNNTKLGYYNLKTAQATGDFYLQQNPTITAGLGDTGNDMIIYGSKMYFVMNNSAKITVVNAANATFIKNISFLSGAVNKSPRYAASARGKVYVTAYDNTVSVIDTTTLTIVKTIMVGANPEGIAAGPNYLYVANSGAFNLVPDSTVSLIDLNTETEIRKIKVGVNPNKIEINNAGNVYVSAYGDFGAKPASISVIDGAVNLTSTNLGSAYPYSHLRIFNNIAYFYNNYSPGGPLAKIKVYNTATGSLVRNEFITDGTVITNTYGINIDITGEVYVADAPSFTTAGRVVCFTDAGVKKFEFSTAPGVNPNKVLLNR